tara:strand:- start:4195 stop:4638 length:444 start_codon:yes stop_codon:yes gene_type:complete
LLVDLRKTLILAPTLTEAAPDTMNQNAFISQLDDVPWDTSDQNPGLTYKLLLDASNAETDGFSFGILRLAPGASLLPHHHDPQESYFILEGEGLMHLNESEQTVGPGSVIYIPRCHRHGITNTGSEPLVFIWTFPTDTWSEVEYYYG